MKLNEVTQYLFDEDVEKIAKELGITPQEAAEGIEDIEDTYEEVRSTLRSGKDQLNTWYIGFYDGYYNLKEKTNWMADKHYYAGFEEGQSEGAAHHSFKMMVSKASLKSAKPANPY